SGVLGIEHDGKTSVLLKFTQILYSCRYLLDNFGGGYRRAVELQFFDGRQFTVAGGLNVYDADQRRATGKIESEHIASHQIANDSGWRLKPLAGGLRSGELGPSLFESSFTFAKVLGAISSPEIEVATLVDHRY